MGVSPVGLQNHTFWRLVSQVPVVKVGMPNVGCGPFTPQGEAPDFEFPPGGGSPCHWWSLWRGCASAFPTHLMWFPSHFPSMKVLLHPFLGFFRGSCSISICRLASARKEASSGSSYASILIESLAKGSFTLFFYNNL